jgi:hypothetical protein
MHSGTIKPEADERHRRPPWRLEDHARLLGMMLELSPLGLWFRMMVAICAIGVTPARDA